ncbi:transposase [Candidatus Tisiphia endosymbiont of Xenochironomus xenolabis]|uniref:transposase n=1 Tax=unclassified Candidatus Tisiphia TaxID=2996318 RepID=UPI0035C93A5F
MREGIADEAIVRVHACSSGYIKGNQEEAALGRSKGGFSTKIHALVDALGNPLKFILTAGQRNDITQLKILLKKWYGPTLYTEREADANLLGPVNKKFSVAI